MPRRRPRVTQLPEATKNPSSSVPGSWVGVHFALNIFVATAVLWLLLRLADVCGIDLASALREKLDLAAEKYPIDQAFGRPDKYTRYQSP